jgi:putative endonuclease
VVPKPEDWKAKLKALGIRRPRVPRAKREPDRRRLETGAGGEELAARHLVEAGCSILDRNVRYPGGELDLVAEDGSDVVFVEVRTRRTPYAGSALESVTAGKRVRVVRAARIWLVKHPRVAARPVRFDVVAVEGNPPAVTWLRGAFDGKGRA